MMPARIQVRTAFLLAMAALPMLAAQTPGIGTVVRYQKSLEVERNGDRRDLLAGDWLQEGDTIHAAKGRAELQLWGEMTLRLAAKTTISIKQRDPVSGQTVLLIEKGALRTSGERLAGQNRITVETEKFSVTSEDPNLFFKIHPKKSEVAAYNSVARVSLTQGEKFELPAGHMVTITVFERQARIEPIPDWYARMAEEMVKLKPR